jgi:hypothetical protein
MTLFNVEDSLLFVATQGNEIIVRQHGTHLQNLKNREGGQIEHMVYFNDQLWVACGSTILSYKKNKLHQFTLNRKLTPHTLPVKSLHLFR